MRVLCGVVRSMRCECVALCSAGGAAVAAARPAVPDATPAQHGGCKHEWMTTTGRRCDRHRSRTAPRIALLVAALAPSAGCCRLSLLSDLLRSLVRALVRWPLSVRSRCSPLRILASPRLSSPLLSDRTAHVGSVSQCSSSDSLLLVVAVRGDEATTAIARRGTTQQASCSRRESADLSSLERCGGVGRHAHSTGCDQREQGEREQTRSLRSGCETIHCIHPQSSTVSSIGLDECSWSSCIAHISCASCASSRACILCARHYTEPGGCCCFCRCLSLGCCSCPYLQLPSFFVPSRCCSGCRGAG